MMINFKKKKQKFVIPKKIMIIRSTRFKDLKLIKIKRFTDFRGDVIKILNYRNNTLKFKLFESYISISKKGTVRGLHGQYGKYSQSKFIFCLSGKILDIAVDLRKKSKTYGKVFKKIINSKNSMGILIPNGFAHGLIALENNTILINFSSNDYKPDKEFGINIKSMNFKLPRIKMLFSKKDKKLISLKDFLKNNK